MSSVSGPSAITYITHSHTAPEDRQIIENLNRGLQRKTNRQIGIIPLTDISMRHRGTGAWTPSVLACQFDEALVLVSIHATEGNCWLP
jgi:hypothetical protein